LIRYGNDFSHGVEVLAYHGVFHVERYNAGGIPR
jgi:hypothetical protein